MARPPRKLLIDESVAGYYHCLERCVRQAFLMGRSRKEKKKYEHRKEWIERRVEFLAGQMAVEVFGCTVMSNHLHLILRNRPDVVPTWDDQEVARRWWNLCPGRKDKKGRPLPPTEEEIKKLTSDEKKMMQIRGRLSSIPWMMRFIAEHVARRANKEDNCTGRFWEGRYRCQRLLDDAALLACCLYVDLNWIRAGLAETPEIKQFTAAYRRIKAMLAAGAENADDELSDPAAPDGWLSPVRRDPTLDEQQERGATRRATNRGFLPLKRSDYLTLLDQAGRLIRSDKRGAIPQDCKPLLERLRLCPATWIETIENFGRKFHRAVGSPQSMEAEAERCGVKWLAGISHCRTAFL